MSPSDLKWFFAAAVSVLLAICGLNLAVDDSDAALLKLQKAKLSRPAEVVFVGDSSLGHSLDGSLASRSGEGAILNLALTGSYGVAGSKWMLEQYFSRHRQVKAAFIVQTVDVFGRPVDNDLVYRTLRWGIDPKALTSTLRALSKAKALVTGERYVIEGDYPPQGAAMAHPESLPPLPQPTLSESNALALKELGALCRRYEVDCFLALGPIATERVAQARDFAQQMPRFEGIRLLGEATPFAIPTAKIGDSPDHVGPRYRPEYTQAWVELVKAGLPTPHPAGGQ